jgi:hypothetical protein
MLKWLSKEFLIAVIVSLTIALVVISWIRPPIQNRGQQREYTQADVGPFVRAFNKAIDDPVTAGILIANFLLVVAVLHQVRESRKSSEAQLRAYIVSGVGSQYRQGMQRGFKFEFRPVILNSGLTPAYAVRSVSRARFMSAAEAANFDFRVPDPGSTSEVTLGPRQDRFIHTVYERQLSKAELRQYKRGEKFFFVYGTTWYRDAFDRPRYTNHCYFVMWFGKKGVALWQTVARHSDSN